MRQFWQNVIWCNVIWHFDVAPFRLEAYYCQAVPLAVAVVKVLQAICIYFGDLDFEGYRTGSMG